MRMNDRAFSRVRTACAVFAVLFACVWLTAPAGAAEDRRSAYYFRIVEAALAKTAADYPPYEFKRPPQMSHSRVIAEMESGGARDWGVFPVNPQLSEKLIPIEIPIAKGILGYRVFLIRKDGQDRLRRVETLDDLKALRLGAGQDWSITKVFRANGFNVVTGAAYNGLFEMLLNDRFDFFPRGVNEIIDEYEQRKQAMPDLAVDEAVLLYTPLPLFVYVAPSKPELARRLKDGLERMRADGSFDALFLEEHGPLIERLKLNSRKVFRIPNPALAGMDILDRRDLWHVIE